MLDTLSIDRRKLLLLLAVWTAFGLFFGTQNYVRDVYSGHHASLPEYIVGWIFCGYSWALLTIPVLWFVRRLSLSRLGWLRFLLVQIPAAFAFSFVQLAIYLAIATLIESPPEHNVFDFYKFLLANELQSSILTFFAIAAVVTVYDRFFRASEGGPSSVTAGAERNGKTDAVPAQTNGHGTNSTNGFIRRLSVKESGRILLLDVQEIAHISSEGNYVKLHCSKNRYLIRETMSALEKKLDPAEFVRLRRSVIVRIDKIQEFRPTFNGEFEVVLKGGPTLTSSRRYRKNIESVLKP